MKSSMRRIGYDKLSKKLGCPFSFTDLTLNKEGLHK